MRVFVSSSVALRVPSWRTSFSQELLFSIMASVGTLLLSNWFPVKKVSGSYIQCFCEQYFCTSFSLTTFLRKVQPEWQFSVHVYREHSCTGPLLFVWCWRGAGNGLVQHGSQMQVLIFLLLVNQILKIVVWVKLLVAEYIFLLTQRFLKVLSQYFLQ